MKTILIIDDDLGLVLWLGLALNDAGYRAEAARLNFLGPAVLGRALGPVDWLARSPGVCPSGHRRTLAARAVSPFWASVQGEPAPSWQTRDYN